MLRNFGKEVTNTSVFEKPDLTFKKYKIAIFVDSEFWHGKDWENRKLDHKSNHEFLYNKIERNIDKDQEVNKTLLKNGWQVLRFWGKDIEKGLVSYIGITEFKINNSKSDEKGILQI